MFKVGEYYESEIKAVSSYLKDAGFKVDIKGLVTARMDQQLPGRASSVN